MLSVPVVLCDDTHPADALLALTSHDDSPPRTTLLSAIRGALRTPTNEAADARRVNFVTTLPNSARVEPFEEEEIRWNSTTVVWSSGGVIRKTWSFGHEGDEVQTATMGWIEQTAQETSSSFSPSTNGSKSTSSERPTFGPFARYHQTRSQSSRNRPLRVAAIFVFLRGTGKVFLKNGVDYTFSLPFIVRKAWPVHPHGVFLQRNIDPAEMDEASLTGEPLLPTIFSLTTPFSEPAIVGLTSGILGASMTPPTLKDEDENSKKPVKAIPSSEKLVWASSRAPGSVNDIMVTVDTETCQLSVWRYAYLKPKDTPVPLGKNRVNRHRQSMSVATSRRTSSMLSSIDRLQPRSPKANIKSEPAAPELPVLPPDLPPLSALPGMAPVLSTTTTMASIGSGDSVQWNAFSAQRRNSLTRNDLSVTLDRMALGGKQDAESSLIPIEHARMKTSYWVERLFTQEIETADCQLWQSMDCTLFDGRWSGTAEPCLLSILLPASKALLILSVYVHEDGIKVKEVRRIPALAAVSLRITRTNVWDLLVLRPDYQLVVLAESTKEIPLQLRDARQTAAHLRIAGLRPYSLNSASFVLESGSVHQLSLDLVPSDLLTSQTFQILALTIPTDVFFELHSAFLQIWSTREFQTATQFDSLVTALVQVFQLPSLAPSTSDGSLWSALGRSSSHSRLREDRALQRLRRPNPAPDACVLDFDSKRNPQRQALLAPILYALHSLAEEFRVRIDHFKEICRLAPVICRFALIIRPEWADYWKRLCPDAMAGWPPPSTQDSRVDDRLPVWPPDVSAILYGRVSNPEWQVSWHDAQHIAHRFRLQPSLAFGQTDPLTTLSKLTAIYKHLADNTEPSGQKRAERAVLRMVEMRIGPEFLNRLPLGVLSPIREAMRTCQIAPPSDWPLEAYRTVGRNDVAASASHVPEMIFGDGYKATKEFVTPSTARPTIESLVSQTNMTTTAEIDAASGVQLDLNDFTDIRFGQDRRLDEVARLLCSSVIATVKVIDRPELSEHDQAKEQQHQVLRIAERTLALPYGRAMFTFGSLLSVSKEAYIIPKMEFNIRLQPLNVVAAAEAGKLSPESLSWGEFHNGVAAGLRISPSASGVESSWIAFNKPSELTPEHAGFLFGLGLSGHLKELLSWHTFGYLTPKHELTSIGVLLGLAAANVGTGDEHVTKLLVVHTPAFLPTPTVDLNVPLITQAAGLSGIGLLYMGTKNRRMAEVCLTQIHRADLALPDITNEYREAYTYSAALAFGMIMLGKGNNVPADTTILDRLTVLIHGEPYSSRGKRVKPMDFDINLASPAATLALGLMYLRTERQDVADILTIPDTVLALNRIQPSFLLHRVLARALIMWDAVTPTQEWQASQVPAAIRDAIDARANMVAKPADDALELAYYNILAASCFVIGLKFAGTARQEAYMMIIRHYDAFTRLVYTNSQAFDQKIRRSAVRDGLNLISIALSMVMAGTGEISCLRRLRFAYGMYTTSMYHPSFKYGTHVATHASLGLLFLGGGRFTLGTSDAAIASMVAAFFPRAHHVSSENKSYLQALRHLWVIAVEPRCLVARDVETGEVVYLPVKISVSDGQETGTTQLISPTLIPDLDKLAAIRVDTPRYWPFHFDTANIPRHKESLLRSQTLYVKRRTAFLSYTEDPRGSRSLFVRSRSSTGEAATLDFPQLTETKVHPAGDLSEFITSFSNDTLFLAFADHMAREMGETDAERLLHTFSHANLLDSILQGKPQTLQSHLTLYRYRMMSPRSRYFQMYLQDLRFASDFYSKVYERRFSGRRENNYRIPLIRESTVSGALFALDNQLDSVRAQPDLLAALGCYARGEKISVDETTSPNLSELLAWYMLRNCVPVSTLLLILKDLARDSYQRCLDAPPPNGSGNMAKVEQAIKEVLAACGTKLSTAYAARAMNATELLANTLSGDATTRQDATQKLEAASRENYPDYMLMLSSVLVEETTPLHIRNAAGLALKNGISSRDPTRVTEFTNRWLALPTEAKNKIKNDALLTLGSASTKAGSFAAQVVAAIATVELPQNQWPDLIEILLGFVNTQANVNLRIATLQTIGFICESIKPEVLTLRANEILTAVIHGARKEEPSPDVQLAAIHAVYNSLEFVRDNFEREGERNYIMQVVCEDTQSSSVAVQVGAFECLVRIMGLYYDKMYFYMEQALFGLTVVGMKHQDERVALQAVEFWSTVCEEEIDLAIEAQEALDYGETPETESKHFAKVALPEIVPVLLMLLTKQEEGADEDEWNVSMAAGTCLSLLASAVQDPVVPAVIPFIEAHIKSTDWHQREAAVMAFGSILEGPDPIVLTPLVTQALPLLIDMMTDGHADVKDTVAWTLGRICELLIQTIKTDVHLHPLVSALVGALGDEHPRIVANCCWALMNLADQLGAFESDQEPVQTGPLSPYTEGVVQALMRVTESGGNEHNFRTAAYEAISAYISGATVDAIPVVQNTVVAILQRMEQLLSMQNQILGVDDRNNWNELQGNFCSVVVAVIRKLGAGIQPLADRIMTLLLQLIQSAGKTSTVLEDAFLTVGALASALESNFAPYIQAFLPHLYPALKAHEDTQLCTVAVGIIGDIARALGPGAAQYATDFMTVLLENLQSDVLNRNVKISILSGFGDIAMAIGPAFEPFLDTTMTVLRQAGALQPNPLDYDLLDYVGQLREGILEAYTGIVSGFKGTDKVPALLPYVESILELIHRCTADEERTDAQMKLSYGLLGDLAEALAGSPQLKQMLMKPWIAQELRTKHRMPPEMNKTRRWAREMVKLATQ
ncbi:APC1-C domain-containing protein [Mycena kentingensis (nom. inval.)]|nr:APC1-C domain-containing protein [Mycena kentingensis (nom. inval.)]